MLAGRDYENLDLASPLFGEIVVVCCGNSSSAVVSEAFTQYAELVRTVRKTNKRSGQTEQKLCDVQLQISCIKIRTKAVRSWDVSSFQHANFEMSHHRSNS